MPVSWRLTLYRLPHTPSTKMSLSTQEEKSCSCEMGTRTLTSPPPEATRSASVISRHERDRSTSSEQCLAPGPIGCLVVHRRALETGTKSLSAGHPDPQPSASAHESRVRIFLDQSGRRFRPAVREHAETWPQRRPPHRSPRSDLAPRSRGPAHPS